MRNHDGGAPQVIQKINGSGIVVAAHSNLNSDDWYSAVTTLHGCAGQVPGVPHLVFVGVSCYFWRAILVARRLVVGSRYVQIKDYEKLLTRFFMSCHSIMSTVLAGG
jgi:hypothetical protein